MTDKIDYTSSVHTVQVGEREFTVRSLTPNFTDEKRDEEERKAKSSLYYIFRKYMT